MKISSKEYLIIFEALREKYGEGYCSEQPEVAQLQAKLSIMAEVQGRAEEPVS